jgi:hypothetical protein
MTEREPQVFGWTDIFLWLTKACFDALLLLNRGLPTPLRVKARPPAQSASEHLSNECKVLCPYIMALGKYLYIPRYDFIRSLGKGQIDDTGRPVPKE